MEILTPVGRMVQGHPMIMNPVMDKNNVQKITKRGDAQVQCFVALAIQKGTETHWNQTEWGQKIQAAGVAAWPNGEHSSPRFAWKITDGDSTVPNTKGKLPCDREGFPGHWIIGASNGFPIDCYANKNYTTKVMRKETFKTGDYARMVLSVKCNDSNDSPGIYVNLSGFELIQAGVEIESAASFDAVGSFGGAEAAMPTGAQVDPNLNPIPAPVADTPPPAAVSNTIAPPPAPAPDFLVVNGQKHSIQSLKDGGWTDEQIKAHK